MLVQSKRLKYYKKKLKIKQLAINDKETIIFTRKNVFETLKVRITNLLINPNKPNTVYFNTIGNAKDGTTKMSISIFNTIKPNNPSNIFLLKICKKKYSPKNNVLINLKKNLIRFNR